MTSETGFVDDLRELLTTFADENVEFVLIGGWAMGARVFHALVRFGTIPYIGRKALLVNKQAAGRPKDLADVDWLEKHPEDE